MIRHRVLLDSFSPSNHKFLPLSYFQVINAVLRALLNVLVLGCSTQSYDLGPLLAALKVTLTHKNGDFTLKTSY